MGFQHQSQAMIIDSHVHICPPWIKDKRQEYCRQEQEFAALYQDPRSRLATASELVQAMQDTGVEKSVVFGFPWRDPETTRLHNDYVLEAARQYPEHLIPFCCLDPLQENALQEAKRCLQLGARGIGELAFYHRDLDQELAQDMKPLLDLVQEAGVPVLLHTNEPVGHSYPGKSPMTLAGLYALLRSSPETTWILAHLGGGLPFFAYLKKEVPETLRNCWLDTAAMPFLYRPQVLPVLAQAVGAEKLLFGTDYPLLGPKRYFKEFAESGLEDSQQDKLLGGNAAALLGLSRD
ncbi:MAG: amidohydrolase family protein [Desulfohalobiaceae bacterium]